MENIRDISIDNLINIKAEQIRPDDKEAQKILSNKLRGQLENYFDTNNLEGLYGAKKETCIDLISKYITHWYRVDNLYPRKYRRNKKSEEVMYLGVESVRQSKKSHKKLVFRLAFQGMIDNLIDLIENNIDLAEEEITRRIGKEGWEEVLKAIGERNKN